VAAISVIKTYATFISSLGL